MVAVLISALALVLSAVTLLRARRLDRRDLFLRLHESLIEPGLVEGRRTLLMTNSREDATSIRADGDRFINVWRALSMFDVLGLYVENKWIDESVVLDEWGHLLFQSYEHAHFYIDEPIGTHVWPHFRRLARKVEHRFAP